MFTATEGVESGTPGCGSTYRDLTGYGTFVLKLDEDRFIDASDFVAILGAPAELLSGVGAFEAYLSLVHPDEREFVRAQERAALVGTRRQFRTEHRVIVDGSTGTVERWVEKSGRVVVGADGQTPIAVAGVFRDVTERRAVEHAKLRLQKLETIATMTSGIAHDFNNVLGPILSYVQLAQSEVDDGLSPRESLREIDRAVERAREIVKRLLAYTREEDPQRSHFSVKDLVDEACALMRPALGPDTTLSFHAASGLPATFGDPTLLHQVVVNLITNAMYAAPGPGATIDLVLDEVPIGSSNTGVLKELTPGAYLRLRVSDNGPGIPNDVMDRLFDPFFTTKPTGAGTGLGLASAQGAVRGHGGAITAENLASSGAIFTVYLPAHEPQNDDNHTEKSPAAPRPALGQPHVLFVDDEAILVKLADRAKPHYGCTVEAHQDPRDALTRVQAHAERYDALITDYSMPHLEGLELIARAKEMKPDIVTILTSGYLTADDHARAKAIGVHAIIPKPCSINDLTNEVARLTRPHS